MPNPDHEFVLHGRSTPIRVKPRQILSNSLKTCTSKNLSQTHLSSRRNSDRSMLLDSTKYNYEFNPVNGSHSNDDDQSWENTEKSELSLDLGSLNSSLNKSFNKSVSFSNKLRTSKREDDDDDDVKLQNEFAEELQRLIDSEIQDADDERDEYVAGKALSLNESVWFTEPLHLIKSKEFPVFESLGIKEQTVSSVRRPAGMTGSELAQRTVASDCSLSEEAREYFPVTLGEVPTIMRTITPSLPADHKPQKRRSSSKAASESASYNNPKLQAASDYSYLKASQPFLDQAVVATPYQYELAKLKMERLRLEEQRLLTTKRDNELERIRGPEPKWYELKTSKFTYEHSKNNKLLKSERDWQDLLNYRSQLLDSNQKFGTL